MITSDDASPNAIPQHDEEYLRRNDSGIQDFFFRDLTARERASFWETMRPWFLRHGYDLYEFECGPPSDSTSWEPYYLNPSFHEMKSSSARSTDYLPFASSSRPPLRAKTNVGLALEEVYRCTLKSPAYGFLRSRCPWPPSCHKIRPGAIAGIRHTRLPFGAVQGQSRLL